MRRQLVLLLVVLLAAGSTTGLFSREKESRKPRFYIKLMGIGSLSKGGDFGDFIDRNDTYYNIVNETDDSYDLSVTKDTYFTGYGGEVGIEVEKYAAGLNVGYLSRHFDIESYHKVATSQVEESYTWKHSFSAVPIFVFIHYKVINSRFLKAFFTIGEGVYLSTYKDDRSITYVNADRTFIESYVRARKNHLGFHAGVSLDFNITRNLALFVDAGFRLVNFKQIKADEYYKDDFEEEFNEDQEFYYAVNQNTEAGRFTAGAGGGIFWDERLAELNLTGFSLNVGIKIIL